MSPQPKSARGGARGMPLYAKAYTKFREKYQHVFIDVYTPFIAQKL